MPGLALSPRQSPLSHTSSGRSPSSSAAPTLLPCQTNSTPPLPPGPSHLLGLPFGPALRHQHSGVGREARSLPGWNLHFLGRQQSSTHVVSGSGTCSGGRTRIGDKVGYWKSWGISQRPGKIQDVSTGRRAFLTGNSMRGGSQLLQAGSELACVLSALEGGRARTGGLLGLHFWRACPDGCGPGCGELWD